MVALLLLESSRGRVRGLVMERRLEVLRLGWDWEEKKGEGYCGRGPPGLDGAPPGIISAGGASDLVRLRSALLRGALPL